MTGVAAMEGATLPRHVRSGDGPSALTEVRDPDVTLALWRRTPSIWIDDLEGFENVRLTTRAEDAVAELRRALDASPAFPWVRAIVADAAMLAGLHASIMEVDAVEIRMDRIVGDACRRFHADYVSARLLCTYVGRGTEWLDQEAAARLANGDAKATADRRSLSAGDVGILKGRSLAGDRALVHRSPPISALGEERLLLVIDPV